MTIKRYGIMTTMYCGEPVTTEFRVTDGPYVKYEDHIEMVQKLMVFYALPRDKQKSAEFLGLEHLFKEMDNGKEEDEGKDEIHEESGEDLQGFED